MTAFANGYQVILYTLLSEALIAFGAVVYLQGVARAVLITQPALVAVQGEPGLAFGFPGGGLHVGFITGAVHRVLRWAGIPAVPNLARPRHSSSGLATPSQAPPVHATFSHTPSYLAIGRPLAGGGSLPGLAGPNPTLPCHASPRQTRPCQTSPCPEKEINLPACLVALAEGCGPGDRRAGQCLRPYRPGASPGGHEKRPRHPSVSTSYHTLERLSRCKMLHNGRGMATQQRVMASGADPTMMARLNAAAGRPSSSTSDRTSTSTSGGR